LFEAGKIRLEELASRDHHHIDGELRPRQDVLPEDLSHQAFRPISCHRVSDFPARHEAESSFACRVRGNDECDVAAMPTGSNRKRPLEICAPSDTPVSTEALGLHDRRSG
jgi:hypothetical protein